MNIRRSYLFVPATNISIVEKAIYSEADCVIIDLEDAVAKSEKQYARESVIEALEKFREKKPIFIRINDISTHYWEDDLACAIKYGATGVVVPKAESINGIRIVCNQVRELIGQYIQNTLFKNRLKHFEVIPLIETAKGIRNVYEIACEDQLIKRLAFGSIDFSLDIDCELTPSGLELLYARSQIVIASKAAEIGAPVDTVYPDLNNPDGLTYEATFAKQLGFKSKLIIHPKQILEVHHVFSPSSKEVENAREIVDAFEKAEKQGIASVVVDDKLVDYPVYKKAKGILSLSNKCVLSNNDNAKG